MKTSVDRCISSRRNFLWTMEYRLNLSYFLDILIEMSKTWPKGKSGEGKQEQIAEQPAKKSAKAKRGREPSW